MTATGSVAEIRAPKAKAAVQGTETVQWTRAPMANVPTAVPTSANSRIGARSAFSLGHGSCRVASNNSGGTSRNRMTSGEMSTATNSPSTLANSPTTTRATVNGNRNRLATTATSAAMASKTTTADSWAMNSLTASPSSAARRYMVTLSPFDSSTVAPG